MKRILGAACVFLAVLAGTAAAQNNNNVGTPNYWVTYAHDQSTGAWGLGWGKTDRAATMNDALARCAKPGCKLGDVMMRRCIAVANRGGAGAPGFGVANTAELASENAIAFCETAPGRTRCSVQSVRCGS